MTQALSELLQPGLSRPAGSRHIYEEALREEAIPLAHFQALIEQGFEIKRGCMFNETCAKIMITLRHSRHQRTYLIETEYRKDGLVETTIYPDGKPLNGSGPKTLAEFHELVIKTAESIPCSP